MSSATDAAPASAEQPPGQTKIVLEGVDGDTSQRIAAALEELIEPPPTAVARFEDGANWRVDAYFETTPDPGELAAELAGLLGIEQVGLVSREVPAENWVTVSQAALPPVTAGRFTVHGSHDRHRVARGPNSILIDAGEAFGTAHHATTAGCLMAIDTVARTCRPRTVLDLGCGSGVLAIAAARLLPRARVSASDIDPIAVEVAAANARRNGTIGIAMTVAAGLPRWGARAARSNGGRYELLIANILAGPLIALAGKLAGAVEPGGRLVLSGLLATQAQAVIGAYLPRGLVLASRRDIAGWSTLVLVRKRALGRAAR